MAKAWCVCKCKISESEPLPFVTKYKLAVAALYLGTNFRPSRFAIQQIQKANPRKLRLLQMEYLTPELQPKMFNSLKQCMSPKMVIHLRYNFASSMKHITVPHFACERTELYKTCHFMQSVFDRTQDCMQSRLLHSVSLLLIFQKRFAFIIIMMYAFSSTISAFKWHTAGMKLLVIIADSCKALWQINKRYSGFAMLSKKRDQSRWESSHANNYSLPFS